MITMIDLAEGEPTGGNITAPEKFWWPALLIALAIGSALTIGDDDWPVSIAAGVLTAAFVAIARHRRVLMTVSAAVIATVLAVAVGEDLAMLPIVSYTCFYLAYHEPPRTALTVGAGIAVALSVMVPVLDAERLEPLSVVGVISLVIVPLLLGIVLQQQRQQVRAQIQAATASHAEQVRLAIARDLHDIVAHGLTAVAIQSGTAIHLFDTKPERAKEALVNVNEASRSALTELRAMVGELRSSDESTPTASDDPIAAAIERISPTMALSVTGDSLPAATPGTVRVALERVAGEALANVIAHGGSGPTTVDLTVATEHLRLTIDNDHGPAGSVGRSTGFGIVGMTERVAALGGTLEAQPRQDGFTVVATIPRGDW